jgi:hypothetical protein
MDVMDILKRYVDVIHPSTFRSAIATEAKRADAKITFLNAVLIGLFGVITLLVSFYLYSSMLNAMFSGTGVVVPAEVPALQQKMMESVAPVSLIVNFLVTLASFYVFNIFLFYVCRALGGEGKLENQLYTTSIIGVSISVIYSLAIILGIGPLACVAVPLALLAMLYLLFLTYITVRAVHVKLDQWRAVGAVVIDVLVLGVAALLITKYFGG